MCEYARTHLTWSLYNNSLWHPRLCIVCCVNGTNDDIHFIFEYVRISDYNNNHFITTQISWILFWSLTWISEKKVKVKGNAKISCNSNCYYYFNRPLFLFSPIHCDVLGYKLKYSWSDLSLLSASDILRYIFCPAECIRYIAIYFVLPSDCDIWPAD